jgi:hypothetical protein
VIFLGPAVMAPPLLNHSIHAEVAVHFVKARGHAAAKVFKVGRLTLPPRATVPFRATFSLAVHTTRVPRPGVHAADVIVNGQARRAGSFVVTAARPRRAR